MTSAWSLAISLLRLPSHIVKLHKIIQSCGLCGGGKEKESNTCYDEFNNCHQLAETNCKKHGKNCKKVVHSKTYFYVYVMYDYFYVRSISISHPVSLLIYMYVSVVKVIFFKYRER